MILKKEDIKGLLGFSRKDQEMYVELYPELILEMTHAPINLRKIAFKKNPLLLSKYHRLTDADVVNVINDDIRNLVYCKGDFTNKVVTKALKKDILSILYIKGNIFTTKTRFLGKEEDNSIFYWCQASILFPISVENFRKRISQMTDNDILHAMKSNSLFLNHLFYFLDNPSDKIIEAMIDLKQFQFVHYLKSIKPDHQAMIYELCLTEGYDYDLLLKHELDDVIQFLIVDQDIKNIKKIINPCQDLQFRFIKTDPKNAIFLTRISDYNINYLFDNYLLNGNYNDNSTYLWNILNYRGAYNKCPDMTNATIHKLLSLNLSNYDEQLKGHPNYEGSASYILDKLKE